MVPNKEQYGILQSGLRHSNQPNRPPSKKYFTKYKGLLGFQHGGRLWEEGLSIRRRDNHALGVTVGKYTHLNPVFLIFFYGVIGVTFSSSEYQNFSKYIRVIRNISANSVKAQTLVCRRESKFSIRRHDNHASSSVFFFRQTINS